VLLLARFFDGLPHGAYFGVASLVAANLVSADRRGRAVSRVMLGLAVSNVAGVPAATWLGQNAGWRSAYWLVTVLAALTAALVLWLVPHIPANREATGRNELRAFKNPQVLLTLLAGAIGFGGMFAMYTYIAPTVTDVAGLPEGRVPLYLLAFGIGMVIGTPLGGRLADWSIFRSLLVSSVAMALTLVLFTWTSQFFVAGLLTAFALSTVSSVLVVNLQMRLMQVAGSAQTIGAAMNHASLNVANALGAWLGGLVIAAGYGYRAPALVGAALSVGGLVILIASAALHRQRGPAAADTPVADESLVN
jgi:MFS transporter, DHA1 family, inner membrane transport protein